MSSLALRPAPRRGLYAVPHFADKATVLLSSFYIAPGFGPVSAELALWGRDRSLLSSSAWSPYEDVGLVFGRDQTPLPNGAEYWSLSAPTPPDTMEIPEHGLFRVRWELHL